MKGLTSLFSKSTFDVIDRRLVVLAKIVTPEDSFNVEVWRSPAKSPLYSVNVHTMFDNKSNLAYYNLDKVMPLAPFTLRNVIASAVLSLTKIIGCIYEDEKTQTEFNLSFKGTREESDKYITSRLVIFKLLVEYLALPDHKDLDVIVNPNGYQEYTFTIGYENKFIDKI